MSYCVYGVFAILCYTEWITLLVALVKALAGRSMHKDKEKRIEALIFADDVSYVGESFQQLPICISPGRGRDCQTPDTCPTRERESEIS